MTKPHEQEWRTETSPGYGRVYIVADDDRMTCETRAEDGDEIARLISAAPDMARALLAFVSDSGHTPDCGYSGYPDHKCSDECAGARAALRKAGVIPKKLPSAPPENQS